MLNPFKRKPSPKYISPLQPIYDQIRERGEVTPELAALLMAAGPVPGSTAAKRDHRGRCFHLGPYPGCRGGCNL